MELKTIKIEKPEATNFILGQSHFIKTVEDIHEAIVQTNPQMKFGLGFCESSGMALVQLDRQRRFTYRDSKEKCSIAFMRTLFHLIFRKWFSDKYS